MKAANLAARRLSGLAERLDALSLRERALIFLAGVTLVCMAWQILLMGPLTAREHAAELRLTEARRQLDNVERIGTAAAAAADPLLSAAARNQALKGRLDALDAGLRSAAHGYVGPERMTDLLRQILADQPGLELVSLRNLPPESLSQRVGVQPAAAAPSAADAYPADIGPFLHPVEIVVDGDYASLIAYLRSIETLQWRIQWQRLELRAGSTAKNRIRIKIGALSLSRDWISI
jgi:MSHA biogenesis protein MshJ